MEQIIMSDIAWYVQDKKEIRPRQNGPMEGRSWWQNLLYESRTPSVDKGEALGVAYLVFSNNSDIISQDILLEKLFMDWMSNKW